MRGRVGLLELRFARAHSYYSTCPGGLLSRGFLFASVALTVLWRGLIESATRWNQSKPPAPLVAVAGGFIVLVHARNNLRPSRNRR
jgi:hypothetical protein